MILDLEEAQDGFGSFNRNNRLARSPTKRKHDEATTSSATQTDHKKPRFGYQRTESTSSSETNRRPVDMETDPGILERRQKQIDYGKNTTGYDNYIQAVPKNTRSKEHPRTPPKHLKYSRRAWDGLIKQWRKQLHTWDPNNEDENDEEVNEDAELIY